MLDDSWHAGFVSLRKALDTTNTGKASKIVYIPMSAANAELLEA
jgi:hypothetical protein